MVKIQAVGAELSDEILRQIVIPRSVSVFIKRAPPDRPEVVPLRVASLPEFARPIGWLDQEVFCQNGVPAKFVPKVHGIPHSVKIDKAKLEFFTID